MPPHCFGNQTVTAGSPPQPVFSTVTSKIRSKSGCSTFMILPPSRYFRSSIQKEGEGWGD